MYVTISVVLEEVNKTNLYVYVIRLCLKYRNLLSSSLRLYSWLLVRSCKFRRSARNVVAVKTFLKELSLCKNTRYFSVIFHSYGVVVPRLHFIIL